MKLQRHVRGQNRGSWVCLVHLDYFQLADIYSCGFKLKISILSSSTHPQLTHQHHPPTHNSLKLVEGWFLLSFSSQTKQKLFSISNFQFSKFQNSWRLEILSKLPLFELDSKVALTRLKAKIIYFVYFFGYYFIWPQKCPLETFNRGGNVQSK